MPKQRNLEVFNFKSEVDHKVRVIEINPGEYWFVGEDVTKALGIVKGRNTIRTVLDSDEIHAHSIGGDAGLRKMLIINESGLYKIILRSRKPEAKRFTNWVTKEVLPSIRRNGHYSTPTTATPKQVAEVVPTPKETEKQFVSRTVEQILKPEVVEWMAAQRVELRDCSLRSAFEQTLATMDYLYELNKDYAKLSVDAINGLTRIQHTRHKFNAQPRAIY
jgi:prophage antirepressor-like protein